MKYHCITTSQQIFEVTLLVVKGIDAFFPELFKMRFHGLHLFRWMRLPYADFSYHPEGMGRAIRSPGHSYCLCNRISSPIYISISCFFSGGFLIRMLIFL